MQGVYRSLKVVCYDFRGPFYVRFPELAHDHFTSIFNVFPGLFNQVHIEQDRFSYKFTNQLPCACNANMSQLTIVHKQNT